MAAESVSDVRSLTSRENGAGGDGMVAFVAPPKEHMIYVPTRVPDAHKSTVV